MEEQHLLLTSLVEIIWISLNEDILNFFRSTLLLTLKREKKIKLKKKAEENERRAKELQNFFKKWLPMLGKENLI